MSDGRLPREAPVCCGEVPFMKPKLQYAGAMAAFGTILPFVHSIPMSPEVLALMCAARS